MSAKFRRQSACRGRSPCCRAIFMDSCLRSSQKVLEKMFFQQPVIKIGISHVSKPACRCFFYLAVCISALSFMEVRSGVECELSLFGCWYSGYDGMCDLLGKPNKAEMRSCLLLTILLHSKAMTSSYFSPLVHN